ncbi:MAG: ABC transporter permease [Proteobacteria bacterium]|nr:ABC transporter permease [Pseudomonadota bacterium]
MIIQAIDGVLTRIGKSTLAMCESIGQLVIFTVIAVSHVFRPPFYLNAFGRQLMTIGFYSLPVVGLTALFTGGALALQIYSGGSRFSAEAVVPSIVAIAMVRELGPVLGGLMVAGRVSTSIAAELGTMRVTEQIDALTTLSTNPMKYLVAPRLAAATITMPILVFIGDTIGIMGGFMVGTGRLGFNQSTYLHNTWDFLEYDDIISGLVKAAVFGFIIALIGCYSGYHSGRGAQGVGNATKSAVVTASVLIFASNYLLTEMFF